MKYAGVAVLVTGAAMSTLVMVWRKDEAPRWLVVTSVMVLGFGLALLVAAS